MRLDMTFPQISDAVRLERLRPPAGRVRMVLDTDTYNETDDQFALAHAMLSPERLTVEAIYAAPFHNKRSDGPGHGMELSYQQILRLLERLGRSAAGSRSGARPVTWAATASRASRMPCATW